MQNTSQPQNQFNQNYIPQASYQENIPQNNIPQHNNDISRDIIDQTKISILQKNLRWVFIINTILFLFIIGIIISQWYFFSSMYVTYSSESTTVLTSANLYSYEEIDYSSYNNSNTCYSKSISCDSGYKAIGAFFDLQCDDSNIIYSLNVNNDYPNSCEYSYSLSSSNPIQFTCLCLQINTHSDYIYMLSDINLHY